MASAKSSIRIGCCGFRSSRETYFEALRAVEVQHTFYQPPRAETLARWRQEAPAGFEFTLKAWQLITHQSSSPTYRRLKRELTEEEKAEAGSFRASETVGEAWRVTFESARALGAASLLFQCPASFRPTGENVENLRRFFGGVERGKMNFCWEPRGGWPRELVKELCEELDLWHAVDPFSERTVTPKRCYFRLHGRRGWRYTYEDAELEELRFMLPKRAKAYVFFNNIAMLEDARRFREIVEGEDES
ncbi:MAG TPA: DUF72 domain-containing protein [Pyrinomonadaceae bacterium]|nr:DUF72 domain-containing protein [Pyrinomonadaceae bacterium]